METQSLQFINEVSAALMRTPGDPNDFNGILHHIAQTAIVSFGAGACTIVAINPITGKYISSRGLIRQGQVEKEIYDEMLSPPEIIQQVLKDGILLIEDLEAKPQVLKRFLRKEGFYAFAGLALRTRHRQKSLGAVCLVFNHPKQFERADYESLRIFAVQASFLLQETWLARNYEQVAYIGQEVNHNLAKVDDLFRVLQSYVDTVLDESHTLLLGLYQHKTNTLDVYVKEQGRVIRGDIPLHGAYKYVVETQRPCFIQHLSQQVGQPSFQIPDVLGIEPKESLIFVPLSLRDVPLGVLSIQHPQPNAYGQEDPFILQLLASYTALALHNMRLYSSLSQLNETGQLLTQQLVSEQALQVIVDQIRDVTEADVVVLYPYEPLKKNFVIPPRMSGTLLDPKIQAVPITRTDNIALLMLRRKKPIFAKKSADLYKELQIDIDFTRANFQSRENLRSTAALPLKVAEDIVGILFVNFRQPQRFDATQKLLIEGLAHYAAIAIKNAQVFGTLSLRRVKELSILQHIDRELTRTLDLDTILNNLLRLAHEHVPAENASILLYNPQTQTLETATVLGHYSDISSKRVISVQQTQDYLVSRVVVNKKPLLVDDIRLDSPGRDSRMPAGNDIISELDVPLLNGDEVVGVLNFASIKEAAFTLEDQEFLVTLSGQAVLAIKNAQTYEREKRLLAEAQVLNEISKELTSQLDISHIFDLILRKALELTDSSTGNLMLYDSGRNDLWMAAESGVVEEKKHEHQAMDQGIVGHVAKTKELLNIDPSDSPWKDVYIPFIPGTHSELSVPMLAGNELRGVINIESPFPHHFGERDERLLLALADLAVVALQNAQAYERERRLAIESLVLNEISRQITSQLDPAYVFKLILENALELTKSHMGNLMLYDPERKDLWMAIERGVIEEKKGKRQGLKDGIVGYVAANKELINIGNVRQPPWKNIFLEYIRGTRSEVAVPLLAGNEIRGVLNVESPVLYNFGERDERLLQGLADLAVVALQNAERYEQAEREAQRFKLLYQAGQELSKINDLAQLNQAYKVVVDIAAKQSQSQAVIYRYDESNADVMLAYASIYRQAPLFERLKLNGSLNGLAAQKRKTIVIHDTDKMPPMMRSIRLSDPSMHSLVVTPIMFKDQYYGNLGLRHEEARHFRGADVLFIESLAQQLTSTIHRLEIAQARQEFEQRAVSNEEMSSIGQSAFELTHRLGNDLGLVELYVSGIKSRLKRLGITSKYISRKLDDILQSVQTVLSFSVDLKQKLTKLGEPPGEPVKISPRILLEDVAAISTLPLNIQIDLEIAEDVAEVIVFPDLVADILRNLVTNAFHAMLEGGTITLRAYNAGRSVAMEVSDTGVGIPPQKLTNIFDLFFSTKGSFGFGLWSARRNALRNHGDLKVESKLNQGTTFRLLLPRENWIIV